MLPGKIPGYKSVWRTVQRAVEVVVPRVLFEDTDAQVGPKAPDLRGRGLFFRTMRCVIRSR